MDTKKLTLKELAYNSIKEKILSCEYSPNMLLNEEMLRQEVQASRTPVRDALSRLEQEGLVRILPKKGVIVTPVSIRDVNMIHETRLLLEPYALKQAGPSIEKDVLRQYIPAFSEDWKQHYTDIQMHQIDLQFHNEFFSRLRNDYLVDLYDRICQQNHRLRILVGININDRISESTAQHRELLELCLEDDWEAAASAMHDHVLSSCRASLSAIMREDTLTL